MLVLVLTLCGWSLPIRLVYVPRLETHEGPLQLLYQKHVPSAVITCFKLITILSSKRHAQQNV